MADGDSDVLLHGENDLANERLDSDLNCGKEESENGNHITLIQAIRKHPKAAAWALAFSSGIILAGFDINIISAVASLSEFQRQYGTTHGDSLIIPAHWLGLWNGGVPLGAIFGSIAGGLIQDRFGRRLSFGIASTLSALCVGIAYVSDIPTALDTRRGIFLLAKTLQGFGNGMILCTAGTYLSETLPPSLRGPGLALWPFATLFGALVAAVVVATSESIPGPASYRTCFATQWPFTALPLAVAVFAPESPAWLVRTERISRARECFARLDSSPFEAERDHAFAELETALQIERKRAATERVSYVQCFRGVDLRRTLIVAFTSIAPELFGLPLFATASYFLQTIGMDTGTSLIFIIIAVVLGILSNLVSFWILTVVGRRQLLIVGFGGSLVLWVSVAIAGFFSSPAAIWYIAICMMCIVLLVGVTAWPAAHVVSAETSSLRLRARTRGVGGCAAQLMSGLISIALPYIYNPDQGNLGGKTGFLFAALCGIAVVMAWATVPEMKDRTVAEIDELFELRLPARKFKSWKGFTPGSVGY